MSFPIFLQLSASGVMLGGLYALIALGLTLIFGVLRLINFAHGEFLMLAMYGSYFLFSLFGIDPYVSIVIVAPALFLLGLVTYAGLIRPTLDKSHLAQVFITLGLSIALMNGVLMLFSGEYRTVVRPYGNSTLGFGGVSLSIPRLVAFVVAMVIAAALFVFLRYTYTGKAIRATAQNRRAAMLVGIDVQRIYLITFAMGCGLVGVAGPLLVPIFTTYPSVGSDYILVAFVVVVLGGLGSLPGAVLGGFLVGLIETFSAFAISSSMKQAIYFLAFIVVLIVLPSGLFGRQANVVGQAAGADGH